MSRFILLLSIMQLILIIICLITSIILILKGIKSRSINIAYLGIGHLLFSVSLILTNIGELLFSQVVMPYMLGFIFLFVFTQLTFHQGKNNHFKIYLFLISLISLGAIILSPITDVSNNKILLFLDLSCEISVVFLTLRWLSVSSMEAYYSLKNQKVEPWIKGRIHIIGITSKLFAISYFTQYLSLLDTYSTEIKIFTLLLNVIFGGLFSISSILVWTIPNWFKTYLNKKYEDNSNYYKDNADYEEMDINSVFLDHFPILHEKYSSK